MSKTDSEQLIESPTPKLDKDIKAAAQTMEPREARYMTDLYYQMQDNRIRAAGQIRSMQTEPHQTLAWVLEQSEKLENNIRSILGEFARKYDVGRWSQSILGIGPVISAGLIANISLTVWVCMAPSEEKAKRKKPKDHCVKTKSCSLACHEKPVNTVGQIWRYAGLDPTTKWEKGEKRPWNASLKRLCWLIGQSFVKVSNNPKDFYGHYYKHRKEIEIKNNDAGMFADQAEQSLSKKRYREDTQARPWYEGRYPGGTMERWITLSDTEQRNHLLKSLRGEPGSGTRMLPPAHIQQRAERYAVKLFLSHWHQVAFRAEFGVMPPAPYVISQLGHTDLVSVPNWPFE